MAREWPIEGGAAQPVYVVNPETLFGGIRNTCDFLEGSTTGGLAEAVASLAGQDGTVFACRQNHPIDANYTIPANVHFWVARGATFTIANGITLTINGTREIGDYQVFVLVGTGAVSFGDQEGVTSPEWFGAVGDGVTDDYAAIQAAYDALPPTGGKMQCHRHTYQIETTLNFTDNSDVMIEGLGRNWVTRIRGGTSGEPLIDLSGSTRWRFKDIHIEGVTGATSPSVGLLLARSTTVHDSGFHYFENMSVNGYFTQAAVFAYCSEVNTFIHCTAANGTNTGYGYICTDLNSLGVTSPYKTLYASSNVGVATWIGGSIGAEGAGSTGGIAIWLEGLDNLRFIGMLWTSGNANEAVRIDGGDSGTVLNVIFQGIRHEGPVAPVSTFHQRTGNASNILIDGLNSQATTNTWLGEAGTSLARSRMAGVATSLVTYLYDGATLRESFIVCDEKQIRCSVGGYTNILVDCGGATGLATGNISTRASGIGVDVAPALNKLHLRDSGASLDLVKLEYNPVTGVEEVGFVVTRDSGLDANIVAKLVAVFEAGGAGWALHTGNTGAAADRFRIDKTGGIFVSSLKSGANQGAAGAAAGELWVDTGDLTIKLGV